MSLTSCEGALDDILGEWSRPTPGSSTGGAVTSIDLDADEMKLTVGDKGQLTAKVDPAGTAVTWSSDKEEIATVDVNGMVTAVAVGTAIITAEAGDKTATCEVTVTPGLSTPLTLEVLEAGTIIVSDPQGMQYSLNGGAKKIVPDNTPIEGTGLNVGDKVEFYGDGTTIASYSGTKIVGGTADIKVYGNIMSLVDEDNFATNIKLTGTSTFLNLFNGNTKLTDASGLLLPATTLALGCYDRMFNGCTSLTTAPAELPAMTLTDYCYSSMFKGCSQLTETPKLSATTLAVFCCAQMFQDCSSLTTAPELKAETLKPSCYNQMFYGCSKLSSVICLATTLDSNGCNNWLNGAGTDASVTSRTLHIKAGGPDPTHSDWKLFTSGDGGSNKWTAVADQ